MEDGNRQPSHNETPLHVQDFLEKQRRFNGFLGQYYKRQILKYLGRPENSLEHTRTTVDSCLRFADTIVLSELAKGSNFVYSPLSIRAALSLAAAGSKGETLEQFLSFLGSASTSELDVNAEELLGDLVRVNRSDVGNGGESCLSFVNGIWIQESWALKPPFQEIASSIYKAVAEPVDFLHEAPHVEREVNAWVEKWTDGLINDLIPPNTVDKSTRIILANALYFKGKWAEKFDESKTKIEEFHLLNGSIKRVPFMTNGEEQLLKYYDGFKVLRLPYLQDDKEQPSLSMLLYLPNERDGLNNLIRRALSDPRFFDYYYPQEDEEVPVHKFGIPKFKFSYSFEASEMLKNFGLQLPFSEEANFREMVSARPYFSKLFHKATIEVEEKGTTASATTLMSGLSGSARRHRQSCEFVADHPFMFAIRDDKTGALLFLGHVADPAPGINF